MRDEVSSNSRLLLLVVAQGKRSLGKGNKKKVSYTLEVQYCQSSPQLLRPQKWAQREKTWLWFPGGAEWLFFFFPVPPSLVQTCLCLTPPPPPFVVMARRKYVQCCHGFFFFSFVVPPKPGFPPLCSFLWAQQLWGRLTILFFSPKFQFFLLSFRVSFNCWSVYNAQSTVHQRR